MLLLTGESSDATDATDATVIRDAPEIHQYECSDPTATVFRVFISSYQNKTVFLIVRRNPYTPQKTTHPPLRNPNPQSSTPVYRFLGGRCLRQETGHLGDHFLHVCVCARARVCA